MVVVTCLGTWKADNTGGPSDTAKEGDGGAPACRSVRAPSGWGGMRPGAWASRPRPRSDTPLHASRWPAPSRRRPPRTEPGLPGTLAEPWRRL